MCRRSHCANGRAGRGGDRSGQGRGDPHEDGIPGHANANAGHSANRRSTSNTAGSHCNNAAVCGDPSVNGRANTWAIPNHSPGTGAHC